MPSAHAVLSASSAFRWLNCTPSALINAELPDTKSAFAEEGTQAHALAEKKLRSFIKHGRRISFKAPDGEMGEATDGYRDYVIEILNEERARTPDACIEVEVRLDFSKWVPDGFGTGDAIIIGDDTLHIIDLKYGKGVKVDAEDNPQLKLYAAGAIEAYGMLYGFTKVKTHIYQPRLDHISVAEYSVEDMIRWLEDTVKPTAEVASKGDGEQKAGAWCRFCKIRATCKARAEMNQKAFEMQFPKRELDKADIESLLPQLDEIKSWISDIQEYALNQALAGEHYKGFKLVEGRSNRKVVDEPGLISALHTLNYTDEQIMTKPKLKTITDLEKVVGKKLFQAASMGFIEKPKGKPTLVPESDKRPAINTAETDFADELK